MPFETVALDFIVKLPVSQGFDSILTITDQGCTKAAIFVPCNEDITAVTITRGKTLDSAVMTTWAEKYH
jgi:hypothetical protein